MSIRKLSRLRIFPKKLPSSIGVRHMPNLTSAKGLPFRPAARRSGGESARVYASLRRQILEGELAAGVHLSQQTIALAEGTSNGPVISALRRLAFDGLVVHELSHGYCVGDWSETRLDDLLTVRRGLETEAARLAARRAGGRRYRSPAANHCAHGSAGYRTALERCRCHRRRTACRDCAPQSQSWFD